MYSRITRILAVTGMACVAAIAMALRLPPRCEGTYAPILWFWIYTASAMGATWLLALAWMFRTWHHSERPDPDWNLLCLLIGSQLPIAVLIYYDA